MNCCDNYNGLPDLRPTSKLYSTRLTTWLDWMTNDAGNFQPKVVEQHKVFKCFPTTHNKYFNLVNPSEHNEERFELHRACPMTEGQATMTPYKYVCVVQTTNL